MPETRILLRWTALVAVSAALAYGLSRAHFPAALLIGPMLAAIIFGVSGAGLSLPRPLFLGAQAVIGCLVAHSATTEIAATLREDGLIIFAVVGVTVVAGALTGLALTRLRVLPGTTAAWGSSPGGAAAMVAMAEDYGADPRLVAFMQYVRVAAVVLSASLAARLLADVTGSGEASASDETSSWTGLAATVAVAAVGYGLASLLRLPSAPLIGPMLLGAVLHATGLLDIVLPGPVLDAAYAAIGWYVGLRFNRRTLDETLHALPGVLTATGAIILLCGIWAWALTYWLPIDFLTAFLATSPGGLDSVAIIAVGSKADVSFVLAVQTLRLFVVLATGPILAKWIARAVPGEAR
ncbi:AbrB family transcriptional regulator [Methylorubrum aminovorans]